MGYFFFCFLPKWDPFKKNYKLRIGTTSYAQIVSIRHDFVMLYWNRAKLARLLPYHTEVVPTWHDFWHVIFFIFFILLFIYWVVSYVILKINLIHNFLRVLVLRNKKLDNRVWIMFDFSMTGQNSVWQGRSRVKLVRLRYDITESCLIETICAYEVVPNWHDLPKFVIFLKRTPF